MQKPIDHDQNTHHPQGSLPIPRKVVTDVRDKVPRREKAAWAAGAASDAIMTTSIGQIALPVYNIGLGLDPRLVALAMAIPRFIDAFLDPVMGNISDNTRSRWGRRKPFILAGGILVTILYWLTWCPPTTLNSWGIFAYFIILSMLFYIAYTLYLIPQTALGFELTNDYNERTRIQAYRGFAGSIGGLALPYFLFWSEIPLFGGNTVSGIRWVTGIAGLIMMLAILSTVVFCKERASAQKQARIKMRPALRYTMTNVPFIQVLAIIMLVIAACFLSGPLEFYVIKYHVAADQNISAAEIYGHTGFIYAVMSFLMIPVVSFVATHIGKRNTMLLGLGLGTAAFLSTLIWYTPESWWWILAAKALLNPGLNTVWILGFSMIADICDVDELKSGLRREGMFGAMYNTIVIKLGISAITLISGFCIAWTGFKSEVPPSLTVVRNIRYIYALIPAALMTAAFIVTLFYPLSENKVRKVRMQLEARNLARTT